MGVQYLGGGLTDVGVNDVGVKGWTGVGVKGCAMRRSLSPARLVASNELPVGLSLFLQEQEW